MSTVDDRIVKMEFDNAGFSEGVAKTTQDLDKLDKALKLDGASAGLDELRSSVSNFNMDSVSSSVETVGGRFSVLQEIAIGALRRIGEQAVDLGETLIKRATIQPLIEGFSEYEDKMRTIKTIQANTGEELSVISDRLNELNRYADQTVYKFSDMTRNVGMFTTAGVSLSDATNAIKGFSNAAALVNADSAATSRAMVQLSQAMSSGYMRLEDWRSLEMANIAGDKFVEVFKATARAHGVAIDQMIEEEGSFRYTLKNNWLDKNLMVEALTNLTYGERALADAGLTRDEVYQQLVANGYTEEAANQILELATAAEDSAVEIRSWSQLWDTVGESLGSGWAESWEYIVGNMEESTELFSFFGKKITDTIDGISRSRNDMLKVWHDSGGYQALVGIISNLFEGLWRIISPVADAFDQVFGVSGEELAILTEDFARFTESLVISTEDADALGNAFEILFEIVKRVLSDVGSAISFVAPYVIGIFAAIRENLESAFNIVSNVFDAILKPLEAIGSAFAEVFAFDTSFTDSLSSAISLVLDILDRFTSSLILSDENATKLHDTFVRIFSAFKSGEGILSKVFDVIVSLANEIVSAFSGSDIINSFISALTELFSFIKDSLSNLLGISDSVNEKLENVSNKSESVTNRIKGFWESLTVLFKPLADAFSYIGKEIGELFSKVDFSKIFANLQSLGITGILYQIYRFLTGIADKVKETKSIKETLTDVLDGVTKVLDGLKDSLKAFQTSVKAKALLKIAAAMGILAIALVSISTIPSDKILSVLAYIGIAIGAMAASMALLFGMDKLTKGKKVDTKPLLEIAFAIGVVADAVAKMAKIDPDRMLPALLGLAGCVAALAIISNSLGKVESFPKGVLTSFIGISVAVRILAEAVEELGSLRWQDLAKGLVGAIALIAALTAALNFFPNSGKLLASSVALLAMAATIRTLDNSVKELGSMRWQDLLQGLVAVIALIGALTAALNFFPDSGKLLASSVALLAMAATIRTLDNSVKELGSMRWQDLLQGLVAVIALIGALTAALNFFPDSGKLLASSVALLAMASSISSLSKSVFILGSMRWQDLLQGLVAVIALIGALTAALNFFPDSGKLLASSVALLAMASSISSLSKSVFILGSMRWQDLLQGLVAVIALIGALTAALNFFPDSGKLLASSVALLAMSAAINILSDAVERLGIMRWQDLAKGLGSIAAMLIMLCIALTVAQGSLAGAAAILVISIALSALAPAIESLGKLSIGQIATALIGLAGALIIVGVAAYALNGAVIGLLSFAATVLAVSVAVLAISASLAILAFGLQMLQEVDIEKVGGLLLGIAIAIAVLIAVCVGLPVVAPVLLAVGAAFVLLGLACLEVAAAIWLISQSIDAFADMAPEKAAQAGEAMGAAFAGMLKGFTETLGNWLGEMITGLLGGALSLAQGFLAVGMSIVNWIGNGINSFGGWLQEQAANLIGVDLMNGCEEQAKQVGENTGGALVGSMADKIKANKAKATGEIQETVTESTDAVADAAPQMEQAAQTGMVDPMTGAFDKFRQLLPAETQGLVDEWLPKFNVSDQTGAAMDLNMDSMYQEMVNSNPELLAYAEQYGIDLPGMFSQPDLYGEAASANLEGEGGFLPMLSSILSERGLDISTASTEQIVDALTDEPAFQEAGLIDSDSFMNYLSHMLPEGVELADLTKDQILDLLRDPKNFEYVATQDEQAATNGMKPLEKHWTDIATNSSRSALSAITKPQEFSNSGRTNEQSYSSGFQPIVTSSGTIANNAGSATISNLQNHDYAGTGNKIQGDVISGANALIENLANVATSGGRAFVAAVGAADAWGAGNSLAESGKRGAESVDYSSSGAAVAAGFAAGIGARSWEAVQEAQAMASRVKGIINGVMGIASPSKVTRESGQFVAEGFALGIRDNSYMVAQSAEDLANVVPDTLGTGLESLRDSLSAIVDENLDTDPVIRPVLDLTDVNNNAQLLSGLLNGGNQAYTLAGIIQNQDPYGLSSLGSIDTTNRDLVDKIELLRADLQAYTEAAANSAVVMDTGALVGQLTPGIDMAMGQRQIMASRGVF